MLLVFVAAPIPAQPYNTDRFQRREGGLAQPSMKSEKPFSAFRSPDEPMTCGLILFGIES